MTVRTRLCPSPSGHSIHLGNLKTGIFNYVFAMQNGGDFLYKLDDTDQKRFIEGADKNILTDLKWAGIVPNEGHLIGGKYGPYKQSERQHIYKKYVDFLLDKGYAYKCYCTEEELNAKREDFLAKNPKNPFKYPGTCRVSKDLDKPYVIRFKAPTDGAIEFNDIVFGKKLFPNKENFDFVIARSEGGYLYNFCCVIDDIEMQITHIIRGSDHIKNYSQQHLLYEAFGATIPKMAHLSMMMNEQNQKLSKRDAAVLVSDYRDRLGYPPSAVVNFLIRFGWAHGDQEILSMQDIIEHFKLENCGKNDGKFNPKKFASIVFSHLKDKTLISDEEYARLLLPFMITRGIENITADQLVGLIPLVRTRSKTLVEAANELEPIYKDTIPDKDVATKILTNDAKGRLNDLCLFLKTVETWSEDNLRTKTQEWLTSCNSNIKDIGQPARVSIYGRTNSPDLFQVMSVLGKDTTLNRISRAIQ
jgi:glutamyl-tRNA synthetase